MIIDPKASLSNRLIIDLVIDQPARLRILVMAHPPTLTHEIKDLGDGDGSVSEMLA